MNPKTIHLDKFGFRGSIEFSQTAIFSLNIAACHEVHFNAGRPWSKKEMNAFRRAFENGDRIIVKGQLPWDETCFESSGLVESVECGNGVDGALTLGSAEFKQVAIS